LSSMETGALFEKPPLTVVDPSAFSSVRSAIEKCFSAASVAGFLKSMDRSGLRIRSFEAVLGKGLLGSSTKATYDSLTNGDQGQIREFYLASLEKVAPDLRDKFFKLYSYY
jgi:hypothetical protein